MLALDVEHIV
jgi:hypothetical protein